MLESGAFLLRSTPAVGETPRGQLVEGSLATLSAPHRAPLQARFVLPTHMTVSRDDTFQLEFVNSSDSAISKLTTVVSSPSVGSGSIIRVAESFEFANCGASRVRILMLLLEHLRFLGWLSRQTAHAP